MATKASAQPAATATTDPARFIWMDGQRVPWQDANVHLLTHSLHYGIAVFEGIRCYKTARGPAIFRLDAHLERLFRSAKIVGMEIPYTRQQLAEACIDLIRANEQHECYIRPIVYFGAGKFGLNNIGAPVKTAIATWRWGAYLGDDGVRNGIRARISSFTRIHVNAMMTKAKNSGNYANSQMARVEAVRDGYDEAILLDVDGYVAEGSGENIFIAYDRVLETPAVTCILEGITRDSVLRIAEAEKIQVKETRISRDRLYCADEAFFTGTAAEITPIREVDHRSIGDGRPGPLTRDIQAIFKKCVVGEEKRFEKWCTFVG
jgi:branched-chain amino acid aminotransferase